MKILPSFQEVDFIGRQGQTERPMDFAWRPTTFFRRVGIGWREEEGHRRSTSADVDPAPIERRLPGDGAH